MAVKPGGGDEIRLSSHDYPHAVNDHVTSIGWRTLFELSAKLISSVTIQTYIEPRAYPG